MSFDARAVSAGIPAGAYGARPICGRPKIKFELVICIENVEQNNRAVYQKINEPFILRWRGDVFHGIDILIESRRSYVYLTSSFILLPRF